MTQIMNKKNKKSNDIISYVKELGGLLLIVLCVRVFIFGLYQVPTGSMETTMLVGERFFANKLTYLYSSPKQGDVIAFNDPEFAYSNNPITYLFQRHLWGPANWTKRLIATPGQTVKGVIKNGKPEVYVDGKKLDEPYLNKYPLIYVQKRYTEDVKQEAYELLAKGKLKSSDLERYIINEVCGRSCWRSYDPSSPFEDQPFYDIDPKMVGRDAQGDLILLEPGTPLQASSQRKSYHDGKNNWNGTDEFYYELGPNQYWAMGDNRLGSHDSRFFGPIDGRYIHGKIMVRIWSNDSDQGWWIFDLLLHPISFWKQMRWNRFFQVIR